VIRKTYRPLSLKEAISCRNETRGVLHAGGTDLMVRNRQWGGVPRRSAPDTIFIGHLKELQHIRRDGGRLIVGACAILSDLKSHREIPAMFKQIIGDMASPAIRNLATIGGNICNASPAADTLPWLYGVDASILCESVDGQREIAIDRFIRAPGETDLAAHEILTAVIIPCDAFTCEFHRKVAARRANSLSKISFLGLAKKEQRRLTDIRLAFGAVGPTVVRSRELERALVQASLSSRQQDDVWRSMRQILKDYSELIRPIDDQRSTADYRRHAALRLAEDYLRSLSD